MAWLLKESHNGCMKRGKSTLRIPLIFILNPLWSSMTRLVMNSSESLFVAFVKCMKLKISHPICVESARVQFMVLSLQNLSLSTVILALMVIFRLVGYSYFANGVRRASFMVIIVITVLSCWVFRSSRMLLFPRRHLRVLKSPWSMLMVSIGITRWKRKSKYITTLTMILKWMAPAKGW